jgi:hypothetical protein
MGTVTGIIRPATASANVTSCRETHHWCVSYEQKMICPLLKEAGVVVEKTTTPANHQVLLLS